MSFWNKSVIQEYVYYILELNDQDSNKKLSAEFLEEIIPLFLSDEEYVCTLESLARMLGASESNLKRTLLHSYVNDVDYIINYTKSSKVMGRPKEAIWLTKDCLKRLMMQSRNKRAEQVRTYFILLEEVYSENMLQRIQHRQANDDDEESITMSRGPLKSEKFPVGKCVYVVQFKSNGGTVQKIGCTINLNRRFAEHRRTYGFSAKVLYYKMYLHHEYLEKCVQMALNITNIVNESEKELFISNADDIIKAIELCAKSGEEICRLTQQCRK